MKSPITGKQMQLLRERRTLTYRKEEFEVVFHYFHCPDSGESFTTTALDEINIKQVHNQYRATHNLPFPDDLLRIREKYQLSYKKMSEILGFGINTYRKYESGEIPSLANAKLILLADDEEEFRKLANYCNAIDNKTRDKIISRTAQLINERKQNQQNQFLLEYVFGGTQRDAFTGFTRPSLEKLTEIVVYFAKKMNPWKTQLNKLLFYTDFAMYSQHCQSISGLRYRAINMGPVPINFDSLYEYLANNNRIEIEYSVFPDGNTGEKFKPTSGNSFNPENFSEAELDILKKIESQFKDATTRDIVDISHKENAWKENHPTRNLIDYSYGFELKGVVG